MNVCTALALRFKQITKKTEEIAKLASAVMLHVKTNPKNFILFNVGNDATLE